MSTTGSTCIVENVYPLDLEALSERIGVTQEEIVDGLVQMTTCLKEKESPLPVEQAPQVKEVFLLVSRPKKNSDQFDEEGYISALANLPGQSRHKKTLEYILEILFSSLPHLRRILISLPYQLHYLESVIESFPCVQAAIGTTGSPIHSPTLMPSSSKCHVDFLLLPSEFEKEETNTLDAILLAKDAMFEPGFLLIDCDRIFENKTIALILEKSELIFEKEEEKKQEQKNFLLDFFSNKKKNRKKNTSTINNTSTNTTDRTLSRATRPRLLSDTIMSEIDFVEEKKLEKKAKKMVVALTSRHNDEPCQQDMNDTEMNQVLTGLYLCSVDVFRQFDFLRMTQNQIKCLQVAMLHLTKHFPELMESVQLPSSSTPLYHFLKENKNNQHYAFVSYQSTTTTATTTTTTTTTTIANATGTSCPLSLPNLSSKSFSSRVMFPLKNKMDTNNHHNNNNNKKHSSEEEEEVFIDDFVLPEEQPEDFEIQIQSCSSTKKKRKSFNISSSLQVLRPLAIEATTPCASDEKTSTPYIIQVDKSPLKCSQQELLLALPAGTSNTISTKSIHRLDLPSAVQRVTMEATETDIKTGRVSLQLVVQQQVPLIGYMVLFIGLFAVSSLGAALDMLTGVSPLLKLFWRMFGASLTLCPFALWKYWSSRKTRQEWFNFWHQIKWNFCFCGFCYTIFNATFFLALNMTSIGHVYIFSNCHSLLMVVGKFFFKQSGSQLQLHYLEIFGVLIGFIGGTITTLDQQTTAHPTHLTTSSSEQQHQLFSKGIVEVSTSGDLVALLGAFSGCFYLLYAKELRGKLGVWLFLFGMVTVVWVFLIPILFLTLPTLEVSTDPYHGLFGWVFHLNIEAYIVFIGSFCGTMGFVASMKYFEPLVVSVTMLMEPIVATMIGICLGIEAVPGTATFLGGFGVLVGCFLVLLASRTSTKSVEICNKISHSMESHEVTSTVTPEKQRLLSFVSQGEKTNSNTSTKFLSSASNRKTYGSFT